jgi:hypothetical protein
MKRPPYIAISTTGIEFATCGFEDCGGLFQGVPTRSDSASILRPRPSFVQYGSRAVEGCAARIAASTDIADGMSRHRPTAFHQHSLGTHEHTTCVNFLLD